MSLVTVALEKISHTSAEIVDSGSFSWSWETRITLGLRVNSGRQLAISHDPFPNFSPPFLVE
jgi:hypothetical protein